MHNGLLAADASMCARIKADSAIASGHIQQVVNGVRNEVIQVLEQSLPVCRCH